MKKADTILPWVGVLGFVHSSDDNSLPLTSISQTIGFDPNLSDYRDFQLSYDLIRDTLHTKTVGHIRDWY